MGNLKTHYEPHKIRSHPFRCISLPLLSLIIFIVYWFMLIPPIYTLVFFYTHVRVIPPYIFFLIALGVFILILAIIMSFWCCLRCGNENEEHLIPNYSTYLMAVRQHKMDSDRDSLIKKERMLSPISCDMKIVPQQPVDKDHVSESPVMAILHKPELSCPVIINEKLKKDEGKNGIELRESKKRNVPKPLSLPNKSLPHFDTHQRLITTATRQFIEYERLMEERNRGATPLVRFDQYLKLVEITSPMTPPTGPPTPRQVFFKDLITAADKDLVTAIDKDFTNVRKIHDDPRRATISYDMYKKYGGFSDWNETGNMSSLSDANQNEFKNSSFEEVFKIEDLNEENRKSSSLNNEIQFELKERKVAFEEDKEKKEYCADAIEKQNILRVMECDSPPLHEIMKDSDNKLKSPVKTSVSSDAEYFIANVEQTPIQTSNVFIYVSETEKKPEAPKITLVLDTHEIKK